ncbi:cardiolipin synthase [Salibacterium aidingense]|uniref:cardiolipin synthase n=1 Tax=Salibacterium aidingense TaxID=384933 RepID=UPI0004054A11|nr:cardiolipin synthase [Salibacterium aidingense]
MVLFLLILAIFFILLLGFWIDYTFGKKRHNKEQHAVLFPVRKGDIRWFDEGEFFFRDFFEELKRAEDHIHILFYIFRNDSIGSQLIDLLARKAREGITVRVMLDRISGGMNQQGRKQLENAGVSFVYSRPVSFPYLFYSLQRRNHRKITVIDGSIGYTGGFNVGDEYMGRDPNLGFWRDFHLRFAGDGVQDLQTQFIEDWKREKPDDVFPENRYYPSLKEGERRFRFFATDGDGVQESFLRAIQQAKNHIYIASPYFIPGDNIQRELLHARNRGVEISILLPEKRDHPLVKEASYSYLEELVEAEASVYHFQPGFFHAKAVLIDDEFCDVGSANFDKRSFHLNNEMNTILMDEAMIDTVKKTLLKDIQKSTRLQPRDMKNRPLPTRIKEKAADMIEELL